MDLEKRLACAQMLNQLLKQGVILKFRNPKADKEISSEVDAYVRRQLQNLLLKVMGEQTDEAFNNEEMQILKSVAARIKDQAITGAKT